MNIGLDQKLADAMTTSADANERRWTEEVRFQLRQAYRLDRTPAEDMAGVSA
jgi:hypothetical protein